jgi:predicted NUDIX family NTP pyrophosphohydrolase
MLYRRIEGRLELLLAHPGGPYFERRDAGHWTLPKGEPNDSEALVDAARREFAEETGLPLPGGPMIELGTIVQKGGKVVHAWAVEGNLDVEATHSNTIEIEWPPGSGRVEAIPEVDRVAWFAPAEARRRIKAAQTPLIDRLEEVLHAQ